jgi:cellulose synthase/poly-beta-1,6-N-acetylglucosamine synthase-like glycosyltransferase
MGIRKLEHGGSGSTRLRESGVARRPVRDPSPRASEEPSRRPGRPAVSVVIPVRDDAERLEVCLRAIAAQTVRPTEVIVVDNGSSDRSVAVARAHGAVVLHEQRVGIPAASTRGFDAAAADVIARIDADSQLPPDWIEQVTRVFSDPTVDAASGRGWFPSLPIGVSRVLAFLYFGSYTIAVGAAIGRRPLFGSAMALRRSVWLRIRNDVCRVDGELHDDIDLTIHLPRAARVVIDPRLSVGISSRPFAQPATLPRRFRRGMHTIVAHWPAQAPWRRYRATIRARLLKRAVEG